MSLFKEGHYFWKENMIYQDIEFYNVSELEIDNDAYYLLRLPKYCEKNMLQQGINMNRSSIGIELRFILIDDEVEITFKGKNEDGICFIYFGEVQAEWFQSSYVIKSNVDTTIKIKKNVNLDALEEINKGKNSIYPANLVRILFNGTMVQFKKKIGKTKVLTLNNKNILFYGSSITSNSITFIPTISYPSLISKNLKLELKNLGFPGSCRIEKEVVDEISKMKFDYAFLELGINIISEISTSEYKDKCLYLLEQITKSQKKFFVTDIFSYYNEKCGVSISKLNSFRKELKNLCKNFTNITYISGKSLLKNRNYLCADLVHPDVEGHQIIYQNLIKIIRKNIL